MTPIDMVTISREFGAGGSELAIALQARLGWRVLDSEIGHEVAARLGIGTDALATWDEHGPSMLERTGQALLLGSPYLYVDPSIVAQPNADDVAAVAKKVLQEEGGRAPVIIVGHGSQSLFHGRPGALHLRLMAPMESRARRICERRGCSQKEAIALARRLDADRTAYVREYFDRDVRDPLLYHVQINTGLVDIREAAGMIVALIEKSRGEAPSEAAGAPR
jgi:cytidylate kinase